MRRGAALGLATALAVGVAAAAGCAHRQDPPAGTVAAFGAALARGDLKAAYALTSVEYRKRMPYDAFAAAMAADAAESKAFGQRLEAEAPRIPTRLEITTSLGEAVPLVLEEGGWRVDGPVFEAWGQGTPRAALRTFVRALGARRYDVVLRLVPNRYRGELTVEKLRQYWEQEHKDSRATMLDRLRAALGAPIAETGDEAHMPYGPGLEARLVKEDGRWKLEEPE